MSRTEVTETVPDRQARLLGTLGLCRRARQLVTGTDMVCLALRDPKSKPRLVVEAADTSGNTHKKLADKCATYGVPLYRLKADGATLARAVGKTGTLAAAGVTGELANAVRRAMDCPED